MSVSVDARAYGEAVAAVYDRLHPHRGDVEADYLAALADGGRALELGIGTGRVALELVARGVEVHGIDASPAMVAELRKKPGGAAIPVTIGDFERLETVPGGPFALVYCPFNTFFQLADQDAQVRCFAGAAAQLAIGGAFLIDVFVPDPSRYARNQTFETFAIWHDEVVLHAAQHDPLTQTVESRFVFAGGAPRPPVPLHIRYAWPAELDLMARLAGLELAERIENYLSAPFLATSQYHISIYRKWR